MIDVAYIVSGLLFIYGLKLLGSPATAVRGNSLSAVAMFIAVVATLFHQQVISYNLIIIGIVIGAIIGAAGARMVAMTAMPEMVALLNGFGGIASLLVGAAEYASKPNPSTVKGLVEIATTDTTSVFVAVAMILTILIGGLTFTGSLVAWAKLKDLRFGSFRVGQPLLYTGQQVVNSLVLLLAVGISIKFCMNPTGGGNLFIAVVVLPLLIGVMSVIPIGGADMPVVISLLNSYSGLAACAAGFVINNNILIVAGSLVGASGIILTKIMCKAMNRSLANVLFSGFGAGGGKAATGGLEQGEVKPASAEDAYYILEAATTVAIVPGYGLAVAQAQHAVRELGELLEENGAEVSYPIHPVAGRMPGHMNVLLAEANVPYDQLVEMDEINATMETIDVCMVIGANDVVNPAANDDESSPIYGMPVINVEKARTVIVLKRSMSTGFAGIQNALFFKDNTRMLFGDAKQTVQALVAEFKGD